MFMFYLIVVKFETGLSWGMKDFLNNIEEFFL